MVEAGSEVDEQSPFEPVEEQEHAPYVGELVPPPPGQPRQVRGASTRVYPVVRWPIAHRRPIPVRMVPVNRKVRVDETRFGPVSAHRWSVAADVDHPTLDRTPLHEDSPAGGNPRRGAGLGPHQIGRLPLSGGTAGGAGSGPSVPVGPVPVPVGALIPVGAVACGVWAASCAWAGSQPPFLVAPVGQRGSVRSTYRYDNRSVWYNSGGFRRVS